MSYSVAVVRGCDATMEAQNNQSTFDNLNNLYKIAAQDDQVGK